MSALARHPDRIGITDLDRLLQPGGALETMKEIDGHAFAGSPRRRLVYDLFSSISEAIRERPSDHSLSTDRTGMPSASDVSAVVKPAK